MDSKEFLDWANKLTENAQAGVREEIAEHKQHGLDIFYMEGEILIMEKSDGTKYEYKMLDNQPVIIHQIKS